MIVEKGSGRLLGVQMAGKDGVAHRIDVWIAAITADLSLDQIHNLDLAYAPPFAPVWDPILLASDIAMKEIKRL